MKLKPKILLVVAALIIYWSGLCTASAFYDPGTQRWLNRDPIEEKGGPNLVNYVGNNPISMVDPYGLKIRIPSLWPVQVAQCIAAQAKILNASLNKALDDLNSCLSRCNSKSYCINNECRKNCDGIYKLDLATASAYYAAASLSCLAWPSAVPSNPPSNPPTSIPPPPIQLLP